MTPTAVALGRTTRTPAAAMVWLAVLVLPITGLGGIGALGELKGSASIYVMLLAIPVVVATTPISEIPFPRPLFVFFVCLLGWIAVTTAANLESIAASHLHGRTGFNKLITSSMVLCFGVIVSLIGIAVFHTFGDLERFFVRPLVWSVVACGLFAIPEIWSWVSSAGASVYQWTGALLHTADDEAGRIPGRLISLAFEAPDLSYFAGFACPWLLLAYRLASRDRETGRVLPALPLLLGLALLVLSNSRTGALMLAGAIASEFVYWVLLRKLRVPATAIAVVAGLAVAGMATLWLASDINQPAIDSEDVSTTSRLALLIAQLSIFQDNPFFGVGFGQYGFHAARALPTWAWDSYEIIRWFESSNDLPPAFNVYGRIGAELGLPGLMIWYGFWGWAALRITQSAARLQAGSPALYVNAALLASIATLMLGGISNDAFRRPETWILIAITATYAGRTDDRSS